MIHIAMINGDTDFQLTCDLEKRLARRRTIEAEIQAGGWKKAHRDSLLLRDHIAAPLLRAALQITGIYSQGIRNALEPVVRHVRFEFDELPEGFDGFRILHLADLHVDGIDGLAEIVAERLRGVDADLCVMTGDYRFEITGPCDEVYRGLRTIMSSVRAHHGVVAVLGNHDQSEMAVELEKLGVRMLINEAAEITRRGSRLWIVGVDDPHFGYDDLHAALDSAPVDGFKVLLAHSPEIFDQAAAAEIRLYLCGHTHAGQIRLPRIGGLLTNADCPRSYAQAKWQHGGMLGYTSAGVGCSFLPVRYNCAPEIPVIELARK
jgi:predicted MPP superfamily phosphohydrolase